MSTNRRTSGVHATPPPKGPNGERLCRNCRGLLPKGKRHNCSPKCSEEWQCKTSPSYLRYVLQKRDKGICALCGVDTIALQEEYRKLPKDQWRKPGDDAETPRQAFLREHGIPWGRSTSDWWDADHITPVIEGGGECGLENYRTLCIPCHHVVTKELAGRLAEKRRKEALAPLEAPLSFGNTEQIEALKRLKRSKRPSSASSGIQHTGSMDSLVREE